MAISKGFPPTNMIAPGIRFTEQDLTYVTAQQTFHRAGLVGFCSKGPINTPTLVTDLTTLYTTFGYPHPDLSDPYLIYAAQLYLGQGSELFVVRVADTDPVSDEAASVASVSVPSVGGLVQAVAANAEPYALLTEVPFYYFSWSLNGIMASKQLSVPSSVTAYTAAALANELNGQLNPDVDGIQFTTVVSGGHSYLAVEATWAYGLNSTLELLSVQNALYGAGSVVGLGSDMSQAEVAGTNTKWPNDSYHTDGHWDWSAGGDEGTLIVVVDGTDNVNIDNVAQEIDLSFASLKGVGADVTTAEIVGAINDLVNTAGTPGGFYAVGGSVADGPFGMSLSSDPDFANATITLRTLASGSGSRMLVKSSSSLSAIFGLPNTTASGQTPAGYTGDITATQGGLIYGADNVGNTDQAFTITAESEGIEGNQTSVVITNLTASAGFQMDVWNNGALVESWGPLSMDQNSNYYIATFLELSSDFVRATNVTGEAPPKGSTTPYSLSGGSDGLPADPIAQDLLLTGTAAGMTGMFALSDPEQIDIDLVACPGHSSSSVVQSLINLCENYRMDCIAIIDPPFGLSPTEIVHWQNGTHPLNMDALNSDCAALYWPWVMINDTFNGINVWVPPSGAVMATYAYSDSISQPYESPAGMSRGIVSGITGVFSTPTATERDLMYQMQNAINPIISFPDVAQYVIWGDKTLQQAPTLLDRVPVRRLLFVIEKTIRQACRYLLFNPHTQAFHDAFTRIAKNVLNPILTNGGIYNYIIQDDWTLNTPDVVAQNEFRANIGIQPVPTVEYIFVTFSLHNQGTWDTANT